MRKIKIFTWQIHGSYLYYLSQANIEICIPVKKSPQEGFTGKGKNFPWGDNVHEIPVDKVKNYTFDCVVFQSKKNYLEDQYEVLSPYQRTLPQIYIEHDPPRMHPTDTRHVVNSPSMLLVHVTHFNNLMWNSNQTPTTVIEHGVTLPKNDIVVRKKNKGIVMINNLQQRGRRLGSDVFQEVKKYIPLDIVGMNSGKIGGFGEIPHSQLFEFLSQYTFFFNPIRYTSLGLSVIEAMMAGLPIVGLATTELSTVITNGIHGYIHTDVTYLIKKMNDLLVNEKKAKKLGEHAQVYAHERFSMQRFSHQWEKVLTIVTHSQTFSENSTTPYTERSIL